VPGNAAVSVGCLWGRPGRRSCGIFVGHAEDLQRLTQGLRAHVAGHPQTCDSSIQDRFAAEPMAGLQMAPRLPLS
jgi:hypothetical protein